MSVVLAAVMIAAGTDLWKFRIYNVLTVPLLLTGILYHGLMAGRTGVVFSVLGVITGAAPLLWPYFKGGMGGGDVKLMAGVGAWLGPWMILHVLIVSGLATGACAAGLYLRQHLDPARGNTGPVPLPVARPHDQRPPAREDLMAVLERPDRRRRAIPFGFLVAVGVAVSGFWVG